MNKRKYGKKKKGIKTFWVECRIEGNFSVSPVLISEGVSLSWHCWNIQPGVCLWGCCRFQEVCNKKMEMSITPLSDKLLQFKLNRATQWFAVPGPHYKNHHRYQRSELQKPEPQMWKLNTKPEASIISSCIFQLFLAQPYLTSPSGKQDRWRSQWHEGAVCNTLNPSTFAQFAHSGTRCVMCPAWPLWVGCSTRVWSPLFSLETKFRRFKCLYHIPSDGFVKFKLIN